MAYKGKFKPKNPKKYKGDASNIIYRSSWELQFMSYCDRSPSIIQWASEEFHIPYRTKMDGKPHRYFPDFWIKKLNNEGKNDIVVIEIKPKYQTVEPKPQKKVTRKYLSEVVTWDKNISKWEAAKEYCADRGWEFVILTEHELGIKF